MSNELLNAHIALGEPCGEDADFAQIADWAGGVITGCDGILTSHQLTLLREIGEYLHVTEYNDDARKEALDAYFRLYDLCTGRT